MSQPPAAPAVDVLLDRLLLEDDPVLAAALRDSAAAGLPAIAVSAQQGKFLQLLAIATGATRVLELGTLGGYSTIWLARAVGPGGAVVTLEYEPAHATVARANLDRAGVGDRVQVLVGPALATLPTLTGGAPFDLVFIDADKENNVAYLRWAVDLCRPGSVIVVDNVIRDGQILQPGDDGSALGARDVLQAMGQDSRLAAAALQTVGVKGWDGFALAVVK